jgi:hypothetical protein
MELKPETKKIFAQFPLLKDLWEDNMGIPVVESRKPHDVCCYRNGDTFMPTFRWVDGVLVEYNEPDENAPYTSSFVADDVVLSLSVGDQGIFDYTHLIEMPEFSLDQMELELARCEAELARVEKLVAA